MQVWLNVAVSLVLLLATYSVNGLKGLNDPCVADHQNQVPCMINKLDEKLFAKLDKVIQLIQSNPRKCKQPLGMRSGAISDGQISASSEWDANHAAIQGRLFFKAGSGKQGAWSSRHNDFNQWLQIDLGDSDTKVTGVASQGRNAVAQWVTKYKLDYSVDGVKFNYYTEGVVKEFAANADQDTVVFHTLNNPITGVRYIRFRPTAWHNHISMRVEIYGCKGLGQTSCKEIYDKGWERENKAYTLNVDSTKIPVYCHMTSFGLGSCGGGGWTLVMKTDGAEKTFHYDSELWTNKDNFNLPGGKTLLDRHETKLPTYWSTPFSKICLVMKNGDQVNSIVINTHANSLYSLIADGKYRSTSLGRNTWKKLIGQQASLQENCNMEGFNVVPARPSACRTRIGIASNEQNDCHSPDSRIGFGGGGYPDDHNTCGNVAKHSPDNGEKSIKAMGYILVQ